VCRFTARRGLSSLALTDTTPASGLTHTCTNVEYQYAAEVISSVYLSKQLESIMLINVQAFGVQQSQQYSKFTLSKRTKYVRDGNR